MVRIDSCLMLSHRLISKKGLISVSLSAFPKSSDPYPLTSDSTCKQLSDPEYIHDVGLSLRSFRS